MTRAPWAAATSPVPSLEPLSTTMTSTFQPAIFNVEIGIVDMTLAMFSASLSAGITIESERMTYLP